MRKRSNKWRWASFQKAFFVLFPLLLITVIPACVKQETGAVETREPAAMVVTAAATESIATPEVAVETPVPELNGENLFLAWRYDTGGAINHPPLQVQDLVIVVPSQGALLALDSETGTLRWKYDPPQRIWDRAYATDGRLLFVGVEGGQLVALEIGNGQEAWTNDLGIDMQVPPLVAGDILFAPTTFVGPGLSNDPAGKATLFALDGASGRTL
jgi:glucose dehydrogenase